MHLQDVGGQKRNVLQHARSAAPGRNVKRISRGAEPERRKGRTFARWGIGGIAALAPVQAGLTRQGRRSLLVAPGAVGVAGFTPIPLHVLILGSGLWDGDKHQQTGTRYLEQMSQHAKPPRAPAASACVVAHLIRLAEPATFCTPRPRCSVKLAGTPGRLPPLPELCPSTTKTQTKRNLHTCILLALVPVFSPGQKLSHPSPFPNCQLPITIDLWYVLKAMSS